MIVERLALPEVLLVKPKVWRDERGQFLEIWRERQYGEHGMGPFVQDNVSVSRKGVLRGLHLQHPHAQGKLVSALRGSVFDVAVDVRRGSPNFAKWVGVELSEENGWQLYVPPGFAHGFQALSDGVVFTYKCTDYYTPKSERTIRWDDQAVGVRWPLPAPLVAPKDMTARSLGEFDPDWLPGYTT